MLEAIDKKILNRIQDGLSISKQPFLTLAQELNLEEGEFVNRLRKLFQLRIIRRMGVILDMRKLGFVSSLIAMKVPLTRIERVAKIINTLKGVTHNYQRKGEYNLWFVLHTRTTQERKKILSHLKRRTGIKEMLDLPTERPFKLKFKLEL